MHISGVHILKVDVLMDHLFYEFPTVAAESEHLTSRRILSAWSKPFGEVLWKFFVLKKKTHF